MSKNLNTYDHKFINSYEKGFLRFKEICSRFLNKKGESTFSKYQEFFYKNFTEKNFSEISLFFDEINDYVTDMIVAIKYLAPKDFRRPLAYYLDLTILLCSELNIKFRGFAMDESRSHVDIYKMDLNNIAHEASIVFNRFKNKDNNVLIVPSDFSLCYNSSDYIIAIFDNHGLFDLPHVYEMKAILPTTIITDQMKTRFQKQRDTNTALMKKYDMKINLFMMYLSHNTYFVAHQEQILKLAKNGKGEIIIDEVFSIILSESKIQSSKDFWFCNLFEEKGYSSIMPLIFRNMRIDFFYELGLTPSMVFIKVNKNANNGGALCL